MENRFDNWTKALAEGMPRRQALRRLGSLFGAALLASLAFGNKAQAIFCYPPYVPCGQICCDGRGGCVHCPNGVGWVCGQTCP